MASSHPEFQLSFNRDFLPSYTTYPRLHKQLHSCLTMKKLTYSFYSGCEYPNHIDENNQIKLSDLRGQNEANS